MLEEFDLDLTKRDVMQVGDRSIMRVVWRPVAGLAGGNVGWESRAVWGDTAERQVMLLVKTKGG